MRLTIIIVMAIVLLTLNSVATIGSIGSQEMGMGFAGISTAEGADVVYWNPAKLGKNLDYNFGISYGKAIHKTNYNHFALVYDKIGFMIARQPGQIYYHISGGDWLTSRMMIGCGFGYLEKPIIKEYTGFVSPSLAYFLNDEIEISILMQIANFNNINVRPAFLMSKKYIKMTIELYDTFNAYNTRHLRSGLEVKTGSLPIYLRAGNYDGLWTFGAGVKIQRFGIDIVKDNKNSITMAFKYN